MGFKFEDFQKEKKNQEGYSQLNTYWAISYEEGAILYDSHILSHLMVTISCQVDTSILI